MRVLNQSGQAKLISFVIGSNYLLNDFSRTDRLFSNFVKLPRRMQATIIDAYMVFARAQSRHRNLPDRLTLFLTNQCNMKCAHCFIVKEHQPKIWEMGTDEYAKLFRSMRGKTSQVLLTGGEPTLRKDLSDILISAGTEGDIRTANIFTNGLRPQFLIETVERAIVNTKLRFNFQTSIDGLEIFHDLNRRVPGAHRKVLETVSQLNRLKAKHSDRMGRIIVTTAVSRSNIDELSDIIALTLDAGALPAFAFVRGGGESVFNIKNPLLLSDFEPEKTKSDGSPKFQTDDFLSVEDMGRVLDILDKNLWSKTRSELSLAYNRVTLESIRNAVAIGKSPITQECRMGYDDLVVLSNGDVARCEMLAAKASLANHDWDLPALVGSEEWQGNLTDTAGCWCTHDCGIGVSIMKEPELIKNLANPTAV